MDYLGYHIAIVICTILSAFFSGTETAVVSASRLNIEYLAGMGKPAARRTLLILDNIEDAVGMILIGNNIVNMSVAAFVVYVAKQAFSLDDTGILVITSIQTVVFLVFCELTPKIVANARADSYLMFFSLPIRILMLLLGPVVRLSLVVASLYKRLFGLKDIRRSLVSSRDEIDIFFDMGQKDGLISYDHRNYVSEILSFRELSAGDIMQPTVSIISVDIKTGLRHLVDTIGRTGFSRIPVYEGRVDNIIGYIFYRDILKKSGVESLDELLIRPLYIPETKNIFELYQEMTVTKVPMVFVVNEHGGVVGMVTHEDIAEEVVGEIQTADHVMEDSVVELDDGRYLLRGWLDIDDMNRRFHMDIEKKDFETLAGFLMYHMKKIPMRGETFEYKKYRFVIDDGTERSVTRVIMVPPRKNRRK